MFSGGNSDASESEVAFSQKMNMGDLLCSKSEFDRAKRFYDEALELKPNDVTCKLHKCRVLLMTGRETEALAIVDQILRDPAHGDDLPSRFMRAEAMYQLGEFEKALVIYQDCHARRPSNSIYDRAIYRAKEAIMNSIGNPDEIDLNIKKNIENIKKQELKNKRSLLSAILNRNGGEFDPSEHLHSDYETFGQKSSPTTTNTINKNNHNNTAVAPRISSATLQRQDIKHQELLLGDLHEDKTFLESSALILGSSRLMRECLEQRIEFLESRKIFWHKQNPIYSRLHCSRKIASSRQNCPLVRSLAKEHACRYRELLAASADRRRSKRMMSAQSCSGGAGQGRSKLEQKVLQIYEELRKREDLQSMECYSSMLADYYYRVGRLKDCLKFQRQLYTVIMQQQGCSGNVNVKEEKLVACIMQICRVLEEMGHYSVANRRLKQVKKILADDTTAQSNISLNIAQNLIRMDADDAVVKEEVKNAYHLASMCMNKEVMRELVEIKKYLFSKKNSPEENIHQETGVRPNQVIKNNEKQAEIGNEA